MLKSEKAELAPASASIPISLRWDAPLPDLAFLGLFLLMALCHLVSALLALGWITAAICDGGGNPTERQYGRDQVAERHQQEQPQKRQVGQRRIPAERKGHGCRS